MSALILGATFVAGSVFAAAASGPDASTGTVPTDNPWFLTQTLKGSQAGNVADWFGRSVAVDGTTALIGAPTTLSTGTARKGAAYVMELEGGNWVEKQVMRGSQQTTTSGPVDNYGYSVAVQGDTAAVTAKTMAAPDGSYHGIVYVYTRSGGTWSEQAIVRAADADAQYDDFGQSLALDGDTLAVGAIGYRPNPSTPQVGRVYVYVRSGSAWTLQATLEADDAGPFMSFGMSMALAGDTLLVGGPGNDGLARPGAVYAFQRSGTSTSTRPPRSMVTTSAPPSRSKGISRSSEPPVPNRTATSCAARPTSCSAMPEAGATCRPWWRPMGRRWTGWASRWSCTATAP